MKLNAFSKIEDALKDIRAGKLVIVTDDPGRENEGDFFLSASLATPEKVHTMIKDGRGLLCVAISAGQAAKLELPLMVSPLENTESTHVNFAVSVNSKRETSSGISAYDRAKTIRILGNEKSKPTDLRRPGHVFPLVAHKGGLRARQGHTEAAVTLAMLAGFSPAGVLCEILKDDGHMARLPELTILAKKLGVKIIAITDLIVYVEKHPVAISSGASVVKTASALLPTQYGKFKISVYRSLVDNKEHVALLLGKKTKGMLARMHSKCLTGDTLFSLTCDCGEQLQKSFEAIEKAGSGVIIYLDQEGRGIGLTNKIRAYKEQQQKGLDTVEANETLGFPPDAREYGIAADILSDLGITDISLLTNNPMKIKALEVNGIHVTKRIPLKVASLKENTKYLTTKKNKLGHLL